MRRINQPMMRQMLPSELAQGLDHGGKNNAILPTIHNFTTIMLQDIHYSGVRYNEVADRPEIHFIGPDGPEIRPWNDADEAASRNHIETEYHLYSRDKHADALRILFDTRRYNPITDIVDDLVWDGEERCEHFLSKWAKVEDTAYTREVSRLIFAGGIHRLYHPGTKFDDVPILIGIKQGEGKSSLIRFLAINDSWYGEINVMEGQPSIEQLKGKWICEIGELLALTKTKEQEAAKAYITRQVDSYRKPWDKNVTELPRRCVMIGSTNRSDPLTDKTGNRRYYPVEIHSSGYDVFDHEQEIRDYILQCWAEARDKMKKGQMPNYADRKLVDAYREAQENAMQDDWRVGAVIDYLDKKLPGEVVCVREIAHRALSPNPDLPKDPTLVEARDIGTILNKRPDWERCKNPRRCGAYGTQRCWVKKEMPVTFTPTEGEDDHDPLDF